MKPFFLFLIAIACYATVSRAQYETQLHKKYKDRAEWLNQLMAQCIENDDTASVMRNIRNLKQVAQQGNDKELALEADLVRAVYMESRGDIDRSVVVRDLNEIIKSAKKEGITQIQARAYKMLGFNYWHIFQNFEQAFQIYLLEDKILEQLSEEDFPDKLENVFYIGQAYFDFSDYKQAIYYLKKAILIKPAYYNRKFLNSSINSLGLCYQYLGKLDSSDYYFKQIIRPDAEPEWVGIAKGNMGQNEFLRGNYKAAIPLLEADYTEALNNNDSGLASGSLMTPAEIAFRQGDIAAATGYTLQAIPCVRNSGQYRRYQVLYPLMSKMYAAQGNLKQSFNCLDSAIYAKDSVVRKFSSLKLLAAYQKIEQQAHESDLKKAEQEKRLKILQRNFLIMSVFITTKP